MNRPKSLVLDIEKLQITVGTIFHINAMFSDLDISFVSNQIWYSLTIGLVHPAHHFDLLGHPAPRPILSVDRLALFDDHLLQSLLAIYEKEGDYVGIT